MEQNNNDKAITFTISRNCIGYVDHRLFGQFLEKASFGEPGPEVAVDAKTGKLKSEVEEFINDMQIPVIRFPGGTDIDSSDWRDMIDNVPGRVINRPEKSITESGSVTNLYSYDEFLQFAERIHTEVILVVNFQDALSRKIPLEEAAKSAAGQVAYCNASVGTKLPDGMPDWPSVRVKNGRIEPYKVRYFQIGNETWVFLRRALEAAGLTDVTEQSQWYIRCINAYIDAMKQIDPSIEIIIDGFTHHLSDYVLANDELASKVDYITYHIYTPWGVQKILKNGVEVPAASLTKEDLWYAWSATPSFDYQGKAVLPDDIITAINKCNTMGRRWNYSMTEWNWNGWLVDVGDEHIEGNSLYVRGIGAAGFLHALMRAGNYMKIATQSNLIGTTWTIGAVRVDSEGMIPPYLYPTGLITTFYGKNHGSRLIELLEENVPVYSQPFDMGNDAYPLKSFKSISMIDAIATENDDAIYFHLINRNYSESYNINIDFSKYGTLNGNIIQHIFQCECDNSDNKNNLHQLAYISDKELGTLKGDNLVVTLPKQSVSVIEIRK